ncbi:unnamed protein product [Trichogramma brassicae]|uniref:Peptidoglycan recognition protein family domain-containing protein n=1 Tax=Trichogramma brassicae TaxID=86971 RepID=A0A6H5IQH5_9HYME|nr:unnamed protein product [Trichogramma brassicae]
MLRDALVKGFEKKKTDQFLALADSAPLLFVQRSQWYAEPARSPPRPLAALPAILAIISHTAGSPCHDLETCAKIVFDIQQYHKYGKGHLWSDIGYNFLVGGDGLVYVGRGWGVEGAHTLGYNAWSLGVALVGKFDATRRLLERAVERGHLARNYTLLGQRQCKQTQSPGNATYAIIKGWPHWSLLPPILAQTTTTTTI